MFFALFGKASRFHFINKKLKQLKKKHIATIFLLLGLQAGVSQPRK